MTMLKGRLAGLLALIPADTRRLADVGCDHGLLSLAFLRRNNKSLALLIDKREGPLAKAEGNLADFIAEGRAHLLLSDGLEAWDPKPGDAVVIAGMGAMEILSILERFASLGAAETADFSVAFIFQPMRDTELLRHALRRIGVTAECQLLCHDRGKVYSAERFSVPLRRLPELRRQDATEDLRDWLGEGLTGFSPLDEDMPGTVSAYLKKQLKLTLNSRSGLPEEKLPARDALIAAIKERISAYENAEHHGQPESPGPA